MKNAKSFHARRINMHFPQQDAQEYSLSEKMEVLVWEHLSTNSVKTNTNNIAYESKITGF